MSSHRSRVSIGDSAGAASIASVCRRRDPARPLDCLAVAAQSGCVGESGTDGHVDGGESLNRGALNAQVDKCPVQRCRAKASDCDGLALRNVAATHAEACSRTDAGPVRRDDLDWIGRIQVETQEPGGGCSRERAVWRQQASPCRQEHPGILPQTSPAIKLTPQTSPCRTSQRAEREPGHPRLRQSKRSFRQP